MNIGVFSCDPGGATGTAWGIFNPHATSVEEMLKTRMEAGSTTVTGDERTQIREIASLWQSFYSACVRSALLPPDRIWLVMEDFILKPGETAGGKDATISLSLIWGLEGYRMGQEDQFKLLKRGAISKRPPMILQMAGQAKSYATGQRLKDWDVWIVGREHERSAWSHIAYFLQKYKQQFPKG